MVKTYSNLRNLNFYIINHGDVVDNVPRKNREDF